jgi:hypothetical protein
MNYGRDCRNIIGIGEWYCFFSFILLSEISKQNTTQQARNKQQIIHEKCEARGSTEDINIRIRTEIAYSFARLLTDSCEIRLDRASNGTKDPQRRHRSLQRSWGALWTSLVLLIEGLGHSGPNRAAVVSPAWWAALQSKDWDAVLILRRRNRRKSWGAAGWRMEAEANAMPQPDGENGILRRSAFVSKRS